MKKIKFLNGISAVFALAVVALATTLTSCEKEEFNVNVTPTNAQAVISPIVLAIEDGVTTDVTGQATIAPAELTFLVILLWLLRVLMLQLLIMV